MLHAAAGVPAAVAPGCGSSNVSESPRPRRWFGLWAGWSGPIPWLSRRGLDSQEARTDFLRRVHQIPTQLSKASVPAVWEKMSPCLA